VLFSARWCLQAPSERNQNEKTNHWGKGIACLCFRAECLASSPYTISTGLSFAPALRFIDPSVGGDVASKKKILIAEDHCDIRRLMAFFLERAGYDVVEAETGLAAIEKRMQCTQI
jgi:hypothetical protein